MTRRFTCLIVEPDPEGLRQVDAACRGLGTIEPRWKTGSLRTADEVLRKHRPDMAIVGLDRDETAAIGAIEAMAKDFPSLFILALSGRSDADLILGAMRAGAHDFLRKPVRGGDLAAAAEKIVKLGSRQDSATPPGRIVSVFSGKGGSGTTTIAANLAEALVRRHHKKVVVADLALSQGDVTMFFNVSPTYSILELAKNAEKADYEFLHSLLVRHQSGVYVLAEPPAIEDAERITPEQIRQALTGLRSMFDLVIVDTPHRFDDRTLSALEMSDVIILVSQLDLPSLRNSQRSLDFFGRLGIRDGRVRLVLNRHLPGGEVAPENAESVLSCPVFATVPNDFGTVIAALNRGRLLREIGPDTEVTAAFRHMAEALLGRETGEAPPPRKPGLLGRMFHFERSRP